MIIYFLGLQFFLTYLTSLLNCFWLRVSYQSVVILGQEDWKSWYNNDVHSHQKNFIES